MTYSEDQLTGWFDIEKQKPWETGVYRVKVEHMPERDDLFSFFNGVEFKWISPRLDSAYKKRDMETNAVVTKWRGLSQNPNAKPKRSGNKRKVMYVVAHKATRCAEAVFSKKKNAQEYAKHLTFSVYITKIRFRTPEHN